MKLVMPIAGKGSRFLKEADRNPEYKRPKPLISVKGSPMVRWATGSLPFISHNGVYPRKPLIESRDIIFLAWEGHEIEYHISTELKKIYGDDIHVIFVPEAFRCGAAATTLGAKEFINHDEPIIVSDSDHFFDGSVFLECFEKYPDAGGAIPLFEVLDGNPKWSFSRVDEHGYIDLVLEKQPISKWANIGAYYFGSGKEYVEAVEKMMEKQEHVNGEYYVAPVYNKIFENGRKVRAVFPKFVYGLGIPADLESFLENTDYELSGASFLTKNN